MTNHIEKAPNTFLFGTTGHSDPNPARRDDEPYRPLFRRPRFVFALLLLVVLFLATFAYLFFAWGLPMLMDAIDNLKASGFRIF
ncbi:hypothetical protein [Arthrobacter mangrovi]|uniref:Uncharacterized protein n=1 Tax=Arthrobacter mangrovi TaxID=2966350 RepID=A0ABQ5MPD2_9MICC|nr:hypothetical protein [Arthrobacter mangrovi]GLB65834.1 hypothetical protein AHIS1636_02730 [Arthrobacter mangrovi]